MAVARIGLVAGPGIATVTTAGVDHRRAAVDGVDDHRAARATTACCIVLHVVAIGAAHIDHAIAGHILCTQNDDAAARGAGRAAPVRVRTGDAVVAIGVVIGSAIIGATRPTATAQKDAVERGGAHIATAASSTTVDQRVVQGRPPTPPAA